MQLAASALRTDLGHSVAENTTLTDGQFAKYQAGDLYVNVHSAANKGGEIRGQVKPESMQLAVHRLISQAT